LFSICAKVIFAQSSTIKINEFLIEPTPQIVELLNTGSEIVDLSNWHIDDNGGTTYFTVPTGTQIYPNACLSFSGSLNLNRTTADAVRLFDSTAPPTSSTANLIDSFEYKSSSGSGVTFQRIPDGQSIWATGSANFDLYNLSGLSCKFDPLPTSVQATYTPTPSPIPITITATFIPTPTPTSGQATPFPTPEIKAIYLSEVYPYPNSGEVEWIELFNDNEFSVFLDNWKIDDMADGGSSPKKISLSIPGYSFKTVDLSSSIFNNDGDSVRVLNTNDQLVDSFSYDSSEKGKSIGRVSFSSTAYCVQNPSKEYSNNSCIIEQTSVTVPTSTPTVTPTPSYKTPSNDRNGTVLGRATGDSKNNNYEPVRPTQYYERPTVDYEKTVENNLKNNNSKTENGPDNHIVSVVRTSALISAVSSFLTAGLIFIRIIL